MGIRLSTHRLLAVLVACGLLLGGLQAWAQTPPPKSPAAGLDGIASAIESVEKAAQRPGLSDEELNGYREQITPLRDQLQERIAELTPQLTQAETRLKQLGPAPNAGAPAEEATIAAERTRLNKLFSETDAALKQARLLVVRADQFTELVNEQRRTLFTRELFTRRDGILDPRLWTTSAAALPDHTSNLTGLFRSWMAFVRDNATSSGAALAAVIVLVAGVIILLLRRWSARLVHPDPASRFSLSLAALIVFAREAVTMPLALFILVMTAEKFDLTSPRATTIGLGLVVALGIASVGRAVARALLTPAAAEHRLFPIEERAARLTAAHLTWGARILAITVAVNTIHKVTLAPVALTVAMSAVLAIANATLVAHLLLRLPRSTEGRQDGSNPPLQWLRALAWLFIAVIAGSLLSGYVGFAAFLAGRLIAAASAVGLLLICLVFVDSLFTEVASGDNPRSRMLAGMLGLSPRGVELAGTLLSGVIRILLVLVTLVPLIGPWGIFAADFLTSLRDAQFGFHFGEVTISLPTIFSAVSVFVVGILLVRGVQHWISRKLLPRAGMEPGLQHSISTLFGYAGFIAVVAVVLGEIGIDLQKIALIAGALSFGIGFGLQSIVSNFVSGLILLTERPIRVGDWVVVKGEEGYVRRISVRATEIETFERASVIVPNSEFITGVVKNWTHANTIGRLSVDVGVAYNSNPEQVRDLLLACAREHPQIMQTPPPQALLIGFGDSALNFQLRCYLANIGYVLAVRSDLHIAILKHFRANGIEIPFPQRDLNWRGPAASPVKAD